MVIFFLLFLLLEVNYDKLFSRYKVKTKKFQRQLTVSPKQNLLRKTDVEEKYFTSFLTQLR